MKQSVANQLARVIGGTVTESLGTELDDEIVVRRCRSTEGMLLISDSAIQYWNTPADYINNKDEDDHIPVAIGVDALMRLVHPQRQALACPKARLRGIITEMENLAEHLIGSSASDNASKLRAWAKELRAMIQS